MSQKRSSRNGLTRRSFLKASGLAATGLAAAGAMTQASEWFEPSSAIAEPEEKIAYTYHQSHCAGHCSFKCTVRDGRLCLLQPNDAWAADHYRTCCLKGLSEIQHVYSKERIQTPMKRVGERGENEFVSISWDEALDIIAENIKKVQDEYGNEAVMVVQASEASVVYPFLAGMLNAQPSGLTGIDIGFANGLDPAVGGQTGYAMSPNEARDFVNAKTVIMSSVNFLETSLVTTQQFFNAKDAGAKIITIDPNFSTTACKSHQWVPINPGTDGALWLTMSKLVIDNDWIDKEFMKHKASYPFLVSDTDGSLLRSQPTDDPTQKGEENPFLVYDENTGQIVPYNAEGIDPALEGTYNHNGQSYTTVFSNLKEIYKDYTIEWGSDKTGISEEDLLDLTEQYATGGPAIISLGWGGNDKNYNADVVGHAVAVLASLTGNFGKPGTGAAVYLGGSYCGHSASLASWDLGEKFQPSENEMPSYLMREEPNSVKAIITTGDVYQQQYANLPLTEEWLKSLDFIAYIDVFHHTSSYWADVILPATTRFESREPVNEVKVAYGHLLGSQQVIEPLFEAKDGLDIERAIAERMGIDAPLPESKVEFCRHQIENSEDPWLDGMTLDELLENQCILELPGAEENVRFEFNEQVKNTASGRVDVYYEDMLEFNQELPRYEEPNELSAESELADKYPLAYTQVKTRFHIHSQFVDAEWIKQYLAPYLEVNKVDMEARGLENDDVVEVYNDRGSFQTLVRANESVRPGTVRFIQGFWSKYMVDGNFQNISNDAINPRSKNLYMGNVIPYNDARVEVKKV